MDVTNEGDAATQAGPAPGGPTVAKRVTPVVAAVAIAWLLRKLLARRR